MSDENTQETPEITQDELCAALCVFLVNKGYVGADQVDAEKTGQAWPTAADNAYKAYVTTKTGTPNPLVPTKLSEVPDVIADDEDFALHGAVIKVDGSKFTAEAEAENEENKARLEQEANAEAESKAAAEKEAAEAAAALQAENDRIAAEQAEAARVAEEERLAAEAAAAQQQNGVTTDGAGDDGAGDDTTDTTANDEEDNPENA